MTYLESYQKCQTEEELKKEVEHDYYVALLLGNNPDRMEKIRQAAQQVADDHGWFLK